MTQNMKVRRPTTADIQQLSKKIELVNSHQRWRAEALILYGMGLKPVEIAMAQGIHSNTGYKDLHTSE